MERCRRERLLCDNSNCKIVIAVPTRVNASGALGDDRISGMRVVFYFLVTTIARRRGGSGCLPSPKDFENLAETLATFVTLASIQLALRRLAQA